MTEKLKSTGQDFDYCNHNYKQAGVPGFARDVFKVYQGFFLKMVSTKKKTKSKSQKIILTIGQVS